MTVPSFSPRTNVQFMRILAEKCVNPTHFCVNFTHVLSIRYPFVIYPGLGLYFRSVSLTSWLSIASAISCKNWLRQVS